MKQSSDSFIKNHFLRNIRRFIRVKTIKDSVENHACQNIFTDYLDYNQKCITDKFLTICRFTITAKKNAMEIGFEI